MSEQERNPLSNPEIGGNVVREAAERERALGEELKEKAEQTEARQDSIESIRDRLEQAQQTQETAPVELQEQPVSETSHLVSAGLQSHASTQTLQRTQRQLSTTDRAFSKVIHQPVVDAVSSAAESTIARPYSLLVAGAFSAISSMIVLYICKHYGYEYNYLIGLASLAAGFAIGLLAEGGYRLFKKLRKS